MVAAIPVMAFAVLFFVVVMARCRPVMALAWYGDGSPGGTAERATDDGSVTTAKLVAEGSADTATNGASQEGVPLSAGKGRRQGQQSGQAQTGKCVQDFHGQTRQLE